jgi:DNA relaxase NicK
VRYRSKFNAKIALEALKKDGDRLLKYSSLILKKIFSCLKPTRLACASRHDNMTYILLVIVFF